MPPITQVMPELKLQSFPSGSIAETPKSRTESNVKNVNHFYNCKFVLPSGSNSAVLPGVSLNSD